MTDEDEYARTVLDAAVLTWPTQPPARARDIDTDLIYTVLGADFVAPIGLLTNLAQRLGAPLPLLQLVGRTCTPATCSHASDPLRRNTPVDNGSVHALEMLALLLDNGEGDTRPQITQVLDGAPSAAFCWMGAYWISTAVDGTDEAMTGPDFVARWLAVAPQARWRASLAGLSASTYSKQPIDAAALRARAAARGRVLDGL